VLFAQGSHLVGMQQPGWDKVPFAQGSHLVGMQQPGWGKVPFAQGSHLVGMQQPGDEVGTGTLAAFQMSGQGMEEGFPCPVQGREEGSPGRQSVEWDWSQAGKEAWSGKGILQWWGRVHLVGPGCLWWQ